MAAGAAARVVHVTSTSGPADARPDAALVDLPDWAPRPGRVGQDVDAVVELLAVLCYGELTAFERLADDARLAPTLTDRGALAGMAAAEFGHYQKLADRLVELGRDPEAVMAPYILALDGFHDSTRPSSWLEGLVKAYVGDGIGTDFYREAATWLDEPDRSLVLEVLGETGQSSFAVHAVRSAIAREPRLKGRLALWARRLVGEALTQAQRVAADRDALVRLIVGGSGDLTEVGALLTRITDAHKQRMVALGLDG